VSGSEPETAGGGATGTAGAPLRVLVMSAGAAPAVAVIKALRAQSRYSMEIGAADAQPRSVGRALADWFATVPSGGAEGFVPALLELCRDRGVEYVFPIIDEELPVWADARDRFVRAGVTVFVNPAACVGAARDKWLTIERCREHGIDCPQSYRAAEARAIPASAFPLFAKPRFGRGSVGAQRIESARQLDDFLARHPDGVVQDLARGAELTVDVLVAGNGALLAAVPKERIEVKAGMATKSVTRALPALVPLLERIVRAFGVAGAANVQLIGGDGGWKLLEVNPKFAASLPLTVAAGVNLPLHLLELARDEFARPTPLAFTAGLLMMRCWEEHFVREVEIQ
jgi:carbamoyl-phosphate synthase large subunit